ncbi:MAG: homoaconitase large subunit [Candidatus Bathyarchaeia archaeon]
MNITEKILAKASGRKEVSPREIVEAEVDVVMVNDLTGPLAVEAFKKIGVKKVWDNKRIVIVLDHLAPASSEKAAELHKTLRKFAAEQNINSFYDVGEGVCHQVMIDEGYVKPGMLIVGADSHTCTYGALGAFATGIGSTEAAAVFATGKIWLRVPEAIKIDVNGHLNDLVTPKDLILHIISLIGADGAIYKSIEFTGSTIKAMSVDGRLTLCNMVVEIGAKNGIIEPDEKTAEYLGIKDFEQVKSDLNASYEKTIEIDASTLEPKVACPHSVDNVKSVREVSGIEVDQAFIGSCTNGRIEDLRLAARILKDRKVKKGTRLIIIPASKKIYMEALREGLIEIFLKAGAVVCNPTCGPCLGGHLGILASGEVCISSSNRNFIGRMGSVKSYIYLASPATVAASAVMGKITDPRDLEA